MRRRTWILLALLLVAFGLRLAYWARSASFGRYELSLDDDEYFQLALLFARGIFFHDPYPLRYTRAPGFPLFLAPIFRAFGSSIEIALVFQIGVSVLTVALTYAFARRAFGTRAGLWAAGLMAIAPIYAATAGAWVLSETLFVFCLLLFLYLFSRWVQAMTLPRALSAGLILGYTALIRPTAFYFLFVVAAWFLYANRVRWQWALPRLALLALGTLALILPYTARNYSVYQRFLLIDSTSGWNLWRDHLQFGDTFAATLATIPNPADRDRYAFQRGAQNILADPVRQLGIQGIANLASVMRLELDALARGEGALSDVNVAAPTLPLVLMNDLGYLFVLIFGAAGILVTWRRAPPVLLLWLGFCLLVLMLYHTLTRFHLHYLFVLVIFAGAALVQGRALWQSLSRPARVAWIGVSALALVLAYSPRILPLFVSEYYLAQAQGRDVVAAQNALNAFPTYLKAHDALGDAYRRQGAFPNALAAYDAALQLNPFEVQAHMGKMDVFRRRGDAKSLEKEIQAAGVTDGQMDLPAPLWWSYDAAPTRLVELGDITNSFGYALNFHGIESSDDEKMRFTRARSFVKFPGVANWKPKSLVFYARAVPITRQALPEVSVRLNRIETARIPLTDKWQDYVIPLSDSAYANDPLIVEFRAPTFRPSDVLPGSTDARELGFMLSYVELR